MDAPPPPVRSSLRLRLTAVVGALMIAASVVALLSIFRPSSPTRPGSSSTGPFGEGAPPVGHPAPDFSLPLFSGGTLSLHSLRGKPVVLNFWASWCAPCRSETPLLVRLRKIYGPRGVVFVGVDIEDEVSEARQFIAQYHVDYAVVRAADERLMEAYAMPGLPTTVFIGADGIVAAKVVGGFIGPDGERMLRVRLDRLLAPARP